MNETIKVEVAYATPDKQKILVVSVPKGSSVYDAAKLSGIDQEFPEIDIEKAPMGIFGKAERKPKEREIQSGERVEIYRPLIADPKEVRKRRAEKKAQEQEKGTE